MEAVTLFLASIARKEKAVTSLFHVWQIISFLEEGRGGGGVLWSEVGFSIFAPFQDYFTLF